MEIVFKHHDEIMDINEKEFVESYKEWCKDGSFFDRKSKMTMERFVEDYFSGLDDCYYYCDNGDEVTEQLLSILTNANIKNVKVMEIEVNE